MRIKVFSKYLRRTDEIDYSKPYPLTPDKQKSAGKNLRILKKLKNFSPYFTNTYEYRTFFS
jgi:hypothetical protein